MDEKYWRQFENSGRIEDYLNFVSHRDDAYNGIGNDFTNEFATELTDRNAAEMKVKQVKADTHAGTYLRDGDDIEDLSRGGVRQAHYPFDERTW